MSNNSAPRKHGPTTQHEQLSDLGEPEFGRGQAMSSQRSHRNRSRHDGHKYSEAISTTSGSSRLGSLLKMGGRNTQGNAGHLQPVEERRNKWLPRGFGSSTDPSEFEDEDTFIPSSEYHGEEAKHLRERNNQLQEQNDKQARLILKLTSDFEEEVRKGNEIKQSAERMVYSMENKELSIGRQYGDEDIHSRFGCLIGQIKTWSVPFAQIRQDARTYSPEAIEEFRKISPGVSDFEYFLQTPKNLRLLVRGYVGFAIAECLFRTIPYAPGPWPLGEDVWMDRELAHSFASIESSLFHSDRDLISHRDLHDWRALTATLISRLDSCNKRNEGLEMGVTACITRIMSLVSNWVVAEDRGKLEDGLRKILSYAVELSQTLRCQRAFWSIRQAESSSSEISNVGFADSLLYFDEGTMNDKYADEDSDGRNIPTSSRKIVEIVISPSLWKRGNTDGERFDAEFCVERSEVKCNSSSSPQRP